MSQNGLCSLARGALPSCAEQPSGESLVEVISKSAEAALAVAESIADRSSPRLAAATVYALGCVSSGRLAVASCRAEDLSWTANTALKIKLNFPALSFLVVPGLLSMWAYWYGGKLQCAFCFHTERAMALLQGWAHYSAEIAALPPAPCCRSAAAPSLRAASSRI